MYIIFFYFLEIPFIFTEHSRILMSKKDGKQFMTCKEEKKDKKGNLLCASFEIHASNTNTMKFGVRKIF